MHVQTKDTGTQSTAHQIANLNMGSDREDMTMDVIDIGTTQQDVEETREETSLSPKRPKRMRVEKQGEQSHERKYSMTRRVVHKNGKS